MGRILRSATAAAILTLSACSNYPRDIGGTLDRIHRSDRLRVGLAAIRPEDRALAEAFVARLERATGATATATTAPAERQLGRLEQGKLDVVLGEFADDTPWLAEVAVIEPLTEHREGRRTLGLAAVAANGENAWVMLLEREVRDLRAGAAP